MFNFKDGYFNKNMTKEKNYKIISHESHIPNSVGKTQSNNCINYRKYKQKKKAQNNVKIH